MSFASRVRLFGGYRLAASRLLLCFLSFAAFHTRNCAAQDRHSFNPPACRLFQPNDIDSGDRVAGRASQLLAIYNDQSRLIRSLKTTAQVRVLRGPKFGAAAGKSKPVAAFLDFEQPAWLRVTGVAPLAGTKLFDLASDSREFHLLAPDHQNMTVFVGPSESSPDFKASSLTLRPLEFLDALRWAKGELALASTSAPQEAAATIAVLLPPRAGKEISGKLKFDLAEGTITSLSLYDKAGAVISEIHYEDWRNTKVDAETDYQNCFPWRVRIVHPAEDVEIDLRFLEITINQKFDHTHFRLDSHRGVKTVRVNE